MRVPMVGGGIAGLIILVISVLLGGDPGAILNECYFSLIPNQDPIVTDDTRSSGGSPRSL